MYILTLNIFKSLHCGFQTRSSLITFVTHRPSTMANAKTAINYWLAVYSQFLSSGTRAHPLKPNLSRRGILQRSCSSAAFCLIELLNPIPPVAKASDQDDTRTKPVRGVVSLPAGYDTDNLPRGNALYVTCRPDRADNVPAAILSGTRGKPPPVLAARFEDPVFPFDFALGENDLTLEGADSGGNWWNNDILVVSARLDSDGVAATRSPDDLVGRGLFLVEKGEGSAPVKIQLSDRGSFGKFITK